MKYLLVCSSMGSAWNKTLSLISKEGIKTNYTDNTGEAYPVKEIFGLNIEIESPKLPDPFIEKYKDEEEYNWMIRNFTSFENVKELSNANSYAERLFRYLGKKNQIDWVIRRLNENPEQRSCTITSFEPLTDEKYIPCVSLLDFQKRPGSDTLDLLCYARALDFGCKAYVNMVMLSSILTSVADRTGLKPGKLELIVKSAHYYIKDEEKVLNIINGSV